MILPATYILTTDTDTIAFILAEVNDHLKESFTDLADEVYLMVLMQAVKEYAEDFTWRTFINKVFTVYFTGWKYSYEIRRSKFVSIASLKYIDADGVTQTVDAADYSTSVDEDFVTLYFDEEYSFPELTTSNPQPIFMEFTAGYGIAPANIPSKIRMAMLQHLAQLWKNRGDCQAAAAGNIRTFIERHLPPASEMIYGMNKITDILM